MREIKFRGRVKMPNRALREIGMEGTEWVHGNLVTNGNTPYIVGNVVEATDEYLTHEFWLPVYLNSVGQYTGLTDRNGVEIYEGDVIESVACMQKEMGHVLFADESFVFKITASRTTTPGSRYFLATCKDLEVIGNIYEHSHLLEGRT